MSEHAKKSEKEIENSILIFLRTVGIYCWKVNRIGVFDPVKKVYRKSNNVFHIKGTSDILGIIQGRMLAIEVKSAIGTLSPEQRIFLTKINEEGGIAFVSRSVEQTAENLLKFFPNNENFKRFCQDYVKSGGHSDH